MPEIQGLDALLKRVNEIALDVRHVERPLAAIGALMLGSIEKNFQQQGRPEKWKPLSPITLGLRRQGKNFGMVRDSGGRLRDRHGRFGSDKGARILIDRARLKNSIGYKVHLALPNSNVEVGTNVVYGPRHHFGYDPAGKKGRGQVRTPARAFLLVQDEDFRDMKEILSRHISR